MGTKIAKLTVSELGELREIRTLNKRITELQNKRNELLDPLVKRHGNQEINLLYNSNRY